MPTSSEITQTALVEYVRGRLPDGIRGEARISFGRSHSANHELRVTWTLPNGRPYNAVLAVSDLSLRASQGSYLASEVDNFVRAIEDANRECLAEMATRFGVEQRGYGFEGRAPHYGESLLGSREGIGQSASAGVGTPRGGTPWRPIPAVFQKAPSKMEPKKLSCWEMLMGNALMGLV